MPYIANTDRDRAEMLRAIGADNMEDLWHRAGVAETARTDPSALHRTPETTPVGRLDETEAARHPDLSSLA